MSTRAVFTAKQQDILSARPSDYERREELGAQFALTEFSRLLSNIQILLTSMDESAKNFAPEEIWPQLVSLLDQATACIAEAARFQASQDNAMGRKNALETTLRSIYGQLFHHIAPVVSYSLGINNYQFSENAVQQAQIRLEDIISTAQKRVDDAADSIAILLDRTRNRSAEIVSTVEAEHFGIASGKFKAEAGYWLIATGVSASILLLVAVVMLFYSLSSYFHDLTPPVIAQILVSKIVVLALFAYVTNVCARSYFASRHNQTVNEHRKNAILSYRALLEPVGSAEHRDVILSHAAAAVFAPQDSAYVKGGAGPEIPTTIINAVTKPLTTP